MHRYPSQGFVRWASYVERNGGNEYIEHGDGNRYVGLVTYKLRVCKSVYRPNYMYMEIMNSNKRTSRCRSFQHCEAAEAHSGEDFYGTG